MKTVKLESGFLAQQLSKPEQKAVWDEVMTDTSPIGKHALFTPQDNLEYFIDAEKKVKFETFQATIRANGKILHVKYNVSNQDEKINKAVRDAYNK